MMKNQINEAIDALDDLVDIQYFVPKKQAIYLIQSLSNNSESVEWAKDAISSISSIVKNMPRLYETEEQGDDAIVYLHYFSGSADFFITEKDNSPEQNRAFGLAKCPETELGYISIADLIESNLVELDLHWTPQSLKNVKEKRL